MTDLLRNAFDLGYRHVDTAVLYGNESLIGESLRAIFSEGKYKREDIFIVTKLFLLPVQTLLKQSRNLFRIYKSSNLIFCMFILLVHPQKTTIGLGITSLYMFNGLNQNKYMLLASLNQLVYLISTFRAQLICSPTRRLSLSVIKSNCMFSSSNLSSFASARKLASMSQHTPLWLISTLLLAMKFSRKLLQDTTLQLPKFFLLSFSNKE